ncbi:uncharacterized protein EI90DRAFT_3071838 [Cantharellus anzutake]|uniref:uncharacterized protein n=1 Tax=Cantharellus anzutake TaxID=1750568 RepID=UPI0019052E25|nr:uncharacterized protein EI90DRAFT_3071838 [Cantharellus anzutake]KAF8325823.1 hypothetical protein EI90DRAFT_3071838 [Cantharellus anzutake]
MNIHNAHMWSFLPPYSATVPFMYLMLFLTTLSNSFLWDRNTSKILLSSVPSMPCPSTPYSSSFIYPTLPFLANSLIYSQFLHRVFGARI